MMGSRLGDLVTWERPAGELELEITAIRYGES
jgi:transcription elongation GreA/GreB family factor